MRVLAVHADEGGVGSYRMVFPVRALQGRGLDVTLDLKADKITAYRDKDKRVVGVAPVKYDVVVFQIPVFKDYVDAIPFIQAQGVAVVVEIDDDYWAIPHLNGARKFYYRGEGDYHVDNLWRAMELADMVTVSSTALHDLVPNKNKVVLPNMIPEWYLTAEVEKLPSDPFTELVVGWTGNPETHAGDLEVMGNSLVRSVRKNKAHFLAIGSEETAGLVGFADDESYWVGWTDLERYPRIVKNLDIGIVPLKQSRFNDSKSYLKGLEYAALGIPFIASPVREYRNLARYDVGDLADHNWYGKLNTMLTSSLYREERAGRGKDFAELNTYELNCHLWWEAWKQATRNVKLRYNKDLK